MLALVGAIGLALLPKRLACANEGKASAASVKAITAVVE